MKHSPELQGIAIFVTGLLWLILGIASLESASSEEAFLGRLAIQFVLLVAGSLIILSWRSQHRSGHKRYR